MKIPFVGPSAQARSLNQNTERTVNCYVEMDKGSPRAPVALYGMPGLTLKTTLAGGAIRGCIPYVDGWLFVAGSHVYKVSSSFVVTDMGTIGTSTGRVGMASNSFVVLLVDGVAGWLVDASSITQISDPDFPNGVTSAAFHQAYFVVAGDGSQKAYWAENPNAGDAWNGLDFASAESAPDSILTCISDGRVVWLFGTTSAEPWVLTGGTSLFERDGNTTIRQGTTSGYTVAELDNTVYWLSNSRNGNGVVLRADGYTPSRISNHALETAIAGYGDVSDAYANTFLFQGHSFYVLTFPTANKTWVYDVESGDWYEWMWRDPSDNSENRHRSATISFNSFLTAVGDWEDGRVYTLDADVYTDAGDPIKRIRRTQSLREGNARLFFGRGEIDMETGVANADCASPVVMLRYSDDDGRTWSNERQIPIGEVGEYSLRVGFGPTGCSKRGKGRVWELSMTDPVKFAVFGADVDVTKGS